jgi:hypothetical protein
VKRLALLLLLGCLGCEPERATTSAPRPPPTEADACTRLCEQLDGCAIAPPGCPARCTRDQARLRAGVQASFTSCLELKLVDCNRRSLPERRQEVSLCWSATLEAWSSGEGKAAIDTVVSAVCTRATRCEAEAAPLDECVKALGKKLAGSAQGKTLAVARPELVASVAACVSKASCAEPHPVAVCSEQQEKEAP